jgi:hypothetical protein
VCDAWGVYKRWSVRWSSRVITKTGTTKTGTTKTGTTKTGTTKTYSFCKNIKKVCFRHCKYIKDAAKCIQCQTKCKVVLTGKCGTATSTTTGSKKTEQCKLVCPKKTSRKVCRQRALVKYGSSSDAKACTRRVFYEEKCVSGASYSKSCRGAARDSCANACTAQNVQAAKGTGKWCLPGTFIKCVTAAARKCIPGCKRVCGATTTVSKTSTKSKTSTTSKTGKTTTKKTTSNQGTGASVTTTTKQPSERVLQTSNSSHGVFTGLVVGLIVGGTQNKTNKKKKKKNLTCF